MIWLKKTSVTLFLSFEVQGKFIYYHTQLFKGVTGRKKFESKDLTFEFLTL